MEQPILHHVTVIKAKGTITGYRVRVAKAESREGRSIDRTFKVVEHEHQPRACLSALQYRDQHLA